MFRHANNVLKLNLIARNAYLDFYLKIIAIQVILIYVINRISLLIIRLSKKNVSYANLNVKNALVMKFVHHATKIIF